MKFSTASLIFLAAIPTFASPVDFTKSVGVRSNNHVLVARAPQAVKCGTGEITTAFNDGKAQSLAATKIKAKNKRKYPTGFNNIEGINLPDCAGIPPPYIEFPILRDNTAFAAGKEQLTDRVLYKDLGGGNFQFCGVDTHEGAVGNGVKACDPVGSTSSSSSASSSASSSSAVSSNSASSHSVSSASVSSAASESSKSSAKPASASSAEPTKSAASSKETTASATKASATPPASKTDTTKPTKSVDTPAASKVSDPAAAPSKPIIAEPSKAPTLAEPSKAPVVTPPKEEPKPKPVVAPPKAPKSPLSFPKLPSLGGGRKGKILL